MKIETILVILFVTVIIFFIIIYCIFLRDDKDIEEVDEEYNIEELEKTVMESLYKPEGCFSERYYQLRKEYWEKDKTIEEIWKELSEVLYK